MADLNKVMLAGRVGNDPDIRQTNAGKPVANFSFATSKKWTDDRNEKHEKTEWHRIVVWGKQAEFVQKYIKKGTALFIEGEVTYEKWQDKEGKDNYTTKIMAQHIQFQSGNPKPADGGQPQQQKPPQQQQEPKQPAHPPFSEPQYSEDDIPF